LSSIAYRADSNNWANGWELPQNINANQHVVLIFWPPYRRVCGVGVVDNYFDNDHAFFSESATGYTFQEINLHKTEIQYILNFSMKQIHYIKSFSKGQITIPKEFRDAFGISEEFWLKIYISAGKIIAEPVDNQPRKETFQKKLLNITGGWIGGQEVMKNRQQVERQIVARAK